MALCRTCSSEDEERNFLSLLPLQQVPLKILEFTSVLLLCRLCLLKTLQHDTRVPASPQCV